MTYIRHCVNTGTGYCCTTAMMMRRRRGRRGRDAQPGGGTTRRRVHGSVLEGSESTRTRRRRHGDSRRRLRASASASLEYPVQHLRTRDLHDCCVVQVVARRVVASFAYRGQQRVLYGPRGRFRSTRTRALAVVVVVRCGRAIVADRSLRRGLRRFWRADARDPVEDRK